MLVKRVIHKKLKLISDFGNRTLNKVVKIIKLGKFTRTMFAT